jgi:citrate lyase subunit beta / citryl-CoA lyase
MPVRVGRDAKEDIALELERIEGSHNEVVLTSSVLTLYGRQIRDLLLRGLQEAGITGVLVVARDSGALDWVILARLEAGLRRLIPDFRKKLLPPRVWDARPQIPRDHLRRSRLYLPGMQPDLMMGAELFHPDGIILDLEDSVAPAEKDAALILVRNALLAVDFGACERMVRINPLPAGLAEIPVLLDTDGVDTFLVPKAERAEDIAQAAQFIREFQARRGMDRRIWHMPILESALGVLKSYEIAACSSDVCALAFGAEDFTKDIGAQRTQKGKESFTARSLVVLGARAAGVQPIDTVYSDVDNEAGLLSSTHEAIALGFEGKGCIHPRQVRTIHEAFRPSEEEAAWALKVKHALDAAQARGQGVVALGSKMIDPPVAARALKVLKMAALYGMAQQEGNGHE